MEALQHEFEECRMKHACLSQELHALSQIYAEERQAHENDVRNLKSELRIAEASRDKLKQDYSTLETERERMLAIKIKLEKAINILNVEIADVKSCLLLLKQQQENLVATHNKQIEEKEETIHQLVKKFSVLQDEISSLEDEKKDLCTQLHAASSGLSELQICKEHLLQLCNNMKDENKVLQLTKISLDRKVEELLHEMNTVIEELEKVKASELLLQENKLSLLEQHSEELHKREEKINRLLKVDRQAYETLLEINCKLQSEIDDMKSKMDEEKKAIRHEYEKKLEKLKAKMVSINTALIRGREECLC
jgi:chromosome segregation ATPase